ncbi:MAG: hypothetical protein IPG96_20845 [Proteobacteria bacterium]|nr:hypothetical protein [Pseudomonadota bacterium]
MEFSSRVAVQSPIRRRIPDVFGLGVLVQVGLDPAAAIRILGDLVLGEAVAVEVNATAALSPGELIREPDERGGSSVGEERS